MPKFKAAFTYTFREEIEAEDHAAAEKIAEAKMKNDPHAENAAGFSVAHTPIEEKSAEDLSDGQ